MPNAPVESAPCGIGARRSRLPPLALFLLTCRQAVSQSSHRIETRTLKIRLHSCNIHPGIGRDRQFNHERIAQGVDKLDAEVIALEEVSFSAQAVTMLDFPGKGITLINAGMPGQNLRIH